MYQNFIDCIMLNSLFHTCKKNATQIKVQMLSRVQVLIDFSLTVKAATLIFISGRGSAISSAKEGKSGSI